jgi:hypothetical protein
MPRGLNRTNLNTTGTSYRNGTPIDLTTHNFGNVVDWNPSPSHFGNESPFDQGNQVDWSPSPEHFGNLITVDAIEFVISTAATNNGSFAGQQTTSPVDTTGANFIVISTFSSVDATISDSLGNTWVTISAGEFGLYYCVTPVVGANHTFTVTQPGSDCSIAVAAFSGVKSVSPLESNTSTTTVSSPTTTVQAATVTPHTGDIIISAFGTFASHKPVSIDSDFTLLDTTGFGSLSATVLAYLVTPSGANVQPTWTVTSNGSIIQSMSALFAHA